MNKLAEKVVFGMCFTVAVSGFLALFCTISDAFSR